MEKYGSVALNIWALYLSFCSIQAFILLLIFFFRKSGNKTANRFLSLALLILGLVIGSYVFNISNLFPRFPHLIYATAPLWFLLGPTVYFYIKVLVEKDSLKNWKTAIHLIPFCYFFIRIFPFYLLSGPAKLDFFIQAQNSPSSTSDLIFGYSYLTQIIVYLILNFRKLNRHIKIFKLDSSDTNLIHLQQLKTIFFVFLVYQIIEALTSFTINIFELPKDEFVYLTYCILSTFILVIGYTSFQATPSQLNIGLKREKDKYENSPLSKNNLNNQLVVLQKTMEEKKPYLNNELKLDDLSDLLKIPSHQLSQILSQGLETNFYDYINSFRIEESKKRLIDPQYKNLTIIGIAFDVGFNSKASFYRVFKKSTNQTPSEFIKQHQFAEVA